MMSPMSLSRMGAPLRKKQINDSVLLICFAFFPLFASCCLASGCLFTSYVSLCAFIAFSIVVFCVKPENLLRYFAFWFGVCANIAGCAVAELAPSFLAELQRESFFAGSLPLLIFSRWLFLALVLIIDTYWVRNYASRRRVTLNQRRVSLIGNCSWILLAIVLLALARAMKLPPAAFLGVDRFSWALMYGEPVLPTFLLNALPYLIVIPLLSIKYGKRGVGVATILLYCFFMIWVGTKFGGFFTIICFAFLVFSDRIQLIDAAKVRQAVGLSVAVLALVVGFAVFSQTSHMVDSGVQYAFSRLAQQGQMWWAIYSDAQFESHPELFYREVNALFWAPGAISDNVGADYGIYGMMYLAAPESLIDAKLGSGSVYTEVGYAAMFYYFGWGGIVAFSVIVAALVALIVRGFLNACHNMDIVRILIWGRFFCLIRTSLGSFLFGDWIDPISLLSYAYLLIVWLMRQERVASKLRVSSYRPANYSECAVT